MFVKCKLVILQCATLWSYGINIRITFEPISYFKFVGLKRQISKNENVSISKILLKVTLTNNSITIDLISRYQIVSVNTYIQDIIWPHVSSLYLKVVIYRLQQSPSDDKVIPTKVHHTYLTWFQMYWDGKIQCTTFLLNRGHLSYKVTLSLQKGWPYKRGTTE